MMTALTNPETCPVIHGRINRLMFAAVTLHVTERGEDNSADHANWIAPELTHTGALLEK